MAPTQPDHRTARPAKSILKSSDKPIIATKSKPKPVAPESLFPNTKADKRRIKHANLISKVHKSSAAASKNAKRQRRPNKKLVATLDSLADALPDADDSPASEGAVGGAVTIRDGADVVDQVNVIRRKSMKSKPGALKRKQALDNQERARWAKNLAQLSAPDNRASAGGNGHDAAAVPVVGSTQDRWAALRGFIGQTLERRADVVASKG
ncbi:uncharacterized protein AB675_691 [Cyphellophora attinorum]|uniref:Ribosome biogenesis protein SLX9 n=1 Tax=Cyphellophora attinorum TaxID=1664694 RepID=A0A0N1HBW6_9EURO|nr:uncharacterized protein AB675_691 [Phialophora attinorum]KPI45793.1 hypothetical protein AB675_691 [Phialophora attinorum]